MSRLFVDGSEVFIDPQIVLFDKDGTLIDIHHYWSSMIRMRSSLIIKRYFSRSNDKDNMVFNLNDSMGIDSKTGRMKKDGPVGIKPRKFIVQVAAETVRRNGVSITDEEIEKIFVEVDEITSYNMLPLLRLLPGVKDLLEKLKKCGVTSVIASTDITSRVHIAMKTLRLDHFFDEIIGGDLVNKTKPEPDLALKVIDSCGCDSSKAVVIGDHPVDILMGESASAGLNIGVLTGLSGFSAFDGMNCRVVNDLTSIDMRC